MSFWQIYWLLKLCDLSGVLYALAFVIFMAMLGTVAFTMDEWDCDKELKNKVQQALGRMFVLIITFILVGFLLPDRKDLAIAFTGSWATNQENIKKMPEDAAKLLHQLIEKTSKELENK